ncbi:MAG: 6-phospho-beta-glucosidase [Clostridiales bacterium]|nr:6-phospho-beta-glucosidase [Clostridiales bacterium]
MKEINVTVIGSGSTYCPELIDGFLKARDSLKIKRIAFMDIDERKRTIVGNLCLRMLKNAGIECETLLTDNLDLALKGADFVVTQIRVGKLPARHLDETIPLKYDLIGQETTGIGGFFKALRTIPVMANITSRMEAICPDAWLINFTNPSGIITEYVLNHTKIKCIGLCNVPINMLDDVKAAVGDKADITYLGLNHLSWISSVLVDGEEMLPKLFEPGFAPTVMKNIHDDGFDVDCCLHSAHGFPSSYLQYYYSRDKKLEHLKESEQSRAQVCMEIEEDLLKMYADEQLVEKPALLDLRGGHKYSLAAVSLIDSIANDKQDVHVVNIKNAGTLDFMADDDIVEIAAVVGKDGAKPVAVRKDAYTRHMVGLMRIVKDYEKYTVEAAVTGSDDAALNALMLHPLIGDYARARACYEEMKEAHKQYLPEFYNK